MLFKLLILVFAFILQCAAQHVSNDKQYKGQLSISSRLFVGDFSAAAELCGRRTAFNAYKQLGGAGGCISVLVQLSTCGQRVVHLSVCEAFGDP